MLVPVEALKSNTMSILRLTLEHNSSNKFKSLIGRFRVSFTEDPRVREQLVPLAKSNWRSIGPFPAVDRRNNFWLSGRADGYAGDLLRGTDGP